MSSSAPSPVVNALSFDIEDWFHMVGIDAVDDPAAWPAFPSLVERYTDQILATLAERNVRATFFTLGWIADRYPALVRRIAQGGHELASHSYWHRQCFKLTPEELREDVRRSIDAIEQASGRKVLGFRAPTFSIVPGSEWVFDVLLDLGVKYDASLFPGVHGGGGYPCPMERHLFTGAPSGRTLPELPMSMMTILGRRIAFSGGGYLRLLPEWLIRRGFDQLHSRGTPVVAYFHPRDFAADCPRVAMPFRRRFKCYVGLGSTPRKFEMLLGRYRFTTCAEVAGIVQN